MNSPSTPQCQPDNRPSPKPLSQYDRSKTDAVKSWVHLVAGAYAQFLDARNSARLLIELLIIRTGGMATAIFTSPLDVLRTRLQGEFYRSATALHTSATGPIQLVGLHFRETFRILASIPQLEGWRGLFRGLGPSLVGVVPATAIKFYTYGNCKRMVSEALQCDQDAIIVPAISAAAAGIVTATATNPIWLVKTRLQLDRSSVEKTGSRSELQYKNSIDCVRQVLRQEGIKGLFRGVTASYLGAAETTLHLVLYEQLKSLLSKRDHGTKREDTGAGISAAAGFSKLIAGLVAYPHEVNSSFYHDYTKGSGVLTIPSGCKNAAKAGATARWAEVYGSYPVFSTGLEGRRDGWLIWRFDAPSSALYPFRHYYPRCI